MKIFRQIERSYAIPDGIDQAALEAGMFGHISCLLWTLVWCNVPELDAIADEPWEKEGPSYLANLSKVPDSIDEAPIEVG